MQVILFTASGAAAGLAGHRLLGRLRRGATVHRGLIVVAVATLWAAAGWRATEGQLPWWWLPIPLTATWFAVLLTAVDLKHSRLPNALTLPAYPALAVGTLLAAAEPNHWQTATTALAGCATLLTLYATIHLATPSALGAGDVKLSGSQGLALGAAGWPAVVVGTALAATLTLALRALAPRRLKTQWQSGIPHGPGLLAATSLLTIFPAVPPLS